MVNISMESVNAQLAEREEAKKNKQGKNVKFGNLEFDEKHYLNTRLEENEEEKEIVIRLLPFSTDELSPFKKIHVHSLRVVNADGKKQWKKFMCPIGMGKSDKCPLCEEANKYRSLKFKATDEAEKKDYGSKEFMFESKDFWLVRCIDRAHEDHGVKFWRFSDRKDGNGIWDKIMSLVKTKEKRGVKILDLYNGKDIVITVKRDNEKLNYQVQDDEIFKPLSESEEQMEKWVYDPIKWDDVYTIKDYDYLKLVAEDKYPVWNKDLNKWVAKSVMDEIQEEAKQQRENDIINGRGEEYSTFKVKTNDNGDITLEDEDDLPF